MSSRTFHRRDRSLSPERRNSKSYDEDGRRGKRKYNYFDSAERKRKPKDPPSIQMIIQGLDEECHEEDVKCALDHYEADYEEIKVVYDKSSGYCKGYCFVRFASLEKSIEFVEENFPEIKISGYYARIYYCKDDQFADWTCSTCNSYNFKKRTVCYKCDAPRPGTVPFYLYKNISEESTLQLNDGLKDSSNAPYRIVLLRKLDCLTKPDKIYQAISRFETPDEVRTIKDRQTNAFSGFAFLVYKDLATAKRLVMMLFHYPDFEIDSCKVEVSYGRESSFVTGDNQLYIFEVYAPPRDLNEDDLDQELENLYAELNDEVSSTLVNEQDFKALEESAIVHQPAYYEAPSQPKPIFDRRYKKKSDASLLKDKGFMTPDEAKAVYHQQILVENQRKYMSDSIGNSLLQQMGWKEGDGLGKRNEGVSSAIETDLYQKGAGIGASIPINAALVSSSGYNEATIIKLKTQERFKE